MKVKDVMMGTPYYCSIDSNLGSVVELMWNGNCGFLPVMGADGKIVGVITDRDVCIALGTRKRLPGETTVGEVISHRLFACAPEDDVHVALLVMKEGGVRRLPVLAPDGSLVGVISMDDVLLKAQPASAGLKPELSSEEVVKAFRVINQRQVPQVVLARGAA